MAINNLKHNQIRPSFGGELNFTYKGNMLLEKKLDELSPLKRLKEKNKLNEFAKDVLSSEYTVKVTESALQKDAFLVKVSKDGEEIVSKRGGNSFLTKLGLKNPIKFITDTFYKVLKNDNQATSEAVMTILRKKL